MTKSAKNKSTPFSGKLAFAPVHPGQLVLHDCLKPLGLSIAKGAEALGVTRAALNNVVRGKSGISPEMALRLSQVFGSSPEVWLSMQVKYDLAHIKNAKKIHLHRIEAAV